MYIFSSSKTHNNKKNWNFFIILTWYYRKQPQRKRKQPQTTQTMSSQMTKTMLQKYESNLTAGQHILHTFTNSSDLQVIRYALLVAQMQSGKTFTYMFLFMEMFRIKRIDTVVIFSGNAELALKKQTQECLDNREFEEFYKRSVSDSKLFNEN